MVTADTVDTRAIRQLWQRLQKAEKLPETWLEDAMHHFLPLAVEIARRHQCEQQMLVIGINGAQGTGKSTLAKALASVLEVIFKLRTTVLSLDDFYIGHEARQQMGREIHPLLATRGVPGTHDVALAQETLEQLRGDQAEVKLPSFSKAIDDRVADSACVRVSAPRDVVILEGWCVGVEPQDSDALIVPVNELEAVEDSDGRWRQYVNTHLGGEYQALFSAISYLIMLKAPSFASVYEWRCLQEQKLAVSQSHASHVMTPDAIARFIQHYQRLTDHCLATLPDQADAVFELNAEHRITRASNPGHTNE